MSTALKCPNPSCPYLFDPSRVPPGVVLTCPRCGMQFTLGPPQAAPPPPPAVHEMAPQADLSAFGGISSEPEAGPDEPRRRSFSAAGEASTLQIVIIAFICFSLLAGVGTVIYMTFGGHSPNRGGGGLDKQLRQHNLSFEVPGAPWARDEDTRARLGSPFVLAFKRTEPDAFIAIGARDFSTREPRIGEMKEALNRVLDRTFDELNRYQIADAKFLGQPAIEAFRFDAKSKDGPTMKGICYSTSYKGIGYWYLAWASEKDVAEQADVFDAIRDQLKLEKHRETWMARQAPINTFAGRNLGYQVLDGDDLWEEADPAKRPATGEDAKADILLLSKKQMGKDFSEEATLIAMILERDGDDPLAQGVKYVKAQQTARVKESNEAFTPMFLERKGDPQGDPPSNPGIETPAPVARFQMTVPGAASVSKLLVISAAKIGDKVVVVLAWCSWQDREVLEAKLTQIAGSLHAAP